MKFFLRTKSIGLQQKLIRKYQSRHYHHTLKSVKKLLTARNTCRYIPHRAFCVPRGFGNFFPGKKDDEKKETKTEQTNKTTEKVETKASDESGSNKNNSNDNKNKDDDKNKQNNQWQQLMSTAPLLLLLALPLLASASNADPNEITYSKFKRDLLEQGRVDYLEVVNKQMVRVHLVAERMGESEDLQYTRRGNGRSRIPNQYDPNKVYTFNIGSVDSFERQLEQAQRDMNLPTTDWVPVQFTTETNWMSVLMGGPFIYVFLIGWGIWIASKRTGEFMANNPMGGMGGKGGPGGFNNIFSISKANVQVLNKGEKITTKFADVAGLQNAKKEVAEFVDFLKNPDFYTKLGAKIPKGALLVGPPGTGKTLLAKAVAGEADCPFFSISGSDFIEMFVGVGPSRVRDLFAQARQNAPCIVFIDEIDAVGRKRGKGGFGGGNDERENTLNQLLVEMDGFKDNSNIVILAGTNRHDILDPALMRPGRFDRQVQVDKPDIKGRIEIFKVHLQKLKTDIDLGEIAQRMATLTPGFAGADIANICNEAALCAARNKKESVEMEDFYYANDRVIGGLEKPMVMSDTERRTIAYHEAGHAVCGWFLENADPLLKVTIIPRGGGALGFAQYLPKELQLYSRDQLYDMMCMTLAGRAAEEIFFGKVTTGASDDLNKVTKIAYGITQIYGMGDAIGHLSYQDDPSGMDKPYKPFSEETSQMIDRSCRELVDGAYERTLSILRERKDYVDALGERLLKDEQLGHDELVEVLGQRPFENDSYRAFIKNTTEFAAKYGADSVKDKTVRDKDMPETSDDQKEETKTEETKDEENKS